MFLELFTGVVIVSLIIGVITLYNGYVIVREGEMIIIERMGKSSYHGSVY